MTCDSLSVLLCFGIFLDVIKKSEFFLHLEIEFGIEWISEVVPMDQLSNRMVFEFGEVAQVLEELLSFPFDLWNPNVGMCCPVFVRLQHFHLFNQSGAVEAWW